MRLSMLLVFTIWARGCILHKPLINYGEVFQNKNVSYVKPIKKPSCGDRIEAFANDTIKTNLNNIRYYEISKDENALFFTANVEINPDSLTENEYLIVFDKECKITAFYKRF